MSDRYAAEYSLNRIFSTPRGAEILSVHENRGIALTLDFTHTGNTESVPFGNTIYVNPYFHPLIETAAGVLRASTLRQLAHELGHTAFGTEDDGPGRMRNVDANENPIMNALGYPSRTRYPPPR